jgi:hypothetical protein
VTRRDRLSVVELCRLREYRLPGETAASAAQRLPSTAQFPTPVRQAAVALGRHVVAVSPEGGIGG